MIDQYFEFKDTQYNRAWEIYDHTINNIPENLRIEKIDAKIFSIVSSIMTCVDSDILVYQMELLSKSLNKDFSNKIHRSFTTILMQLEADEITILKNIHYNQYEFIETLDYEKSKGFFNSKYEKFDYPQDQLFNPDKFWLYIYHLQDMLKLIRWPIYKQEPLTHGGYQTGLVKLSRLVETLYGHEFNKAIFD